MSHETNDTITQFPIDQNIFKGKCKGGASKDDNKSKLTKNRQLKESKMSQMMNAAISTMMSEHLVRYGDGEVKTFYRYRGVDNISTF